jgi:hypothetical protein
MGKASVWFGTQAILFFIGAAAAAAQDGSRYVIVLWAGAAISTVVFAVLGSAYVLLRANRYLKAVRFADDWRCNYWGVQQQMKVTLWFVDKSDAVSYDASCWVQLGQEIIRIDDEVDWGGTYAGRRRFYSGKEGPVMAEFLKNGVRLESPDEVTVTARIKPSGWWKGAAAQKTRTVRVHVVNAVASS